MTRSFNSASSSNKFEDKVMDHGERLASLEERTTHLASKEDLQRSLNAMTWKIIGANAGLVAAVAYLCR